MRLFTLDLRFTAMHQDGESAFDESFEDELEEILEHLAELDGVVDPDVTARLSTGDVMFSLSIEAESGPHALKDALTAVRTAIHACNGGTPGWERLFEEVEQTIRAEDGHSSLVDA